MRNLLPTLRPKRRPLLTPEAPSPLQEPPNTCLKSRQIPLPAGSHGSGSGSSLITAVTVTALCCNYIHKCLYSPVDCKFHGQGHTLGEKKEGQVREG